MSFRKALGRSWSAKRVLSTYVKIFTFQRFRNTHNCRQLVRKTNWCAKKTFPAICDGSGRNLCHWKIPLVFIARNVKMNAYVYQNEILMNVLLPWKHQHFGENDFILQQDLVPDMELKQQLTSVESCHGFWGKDIWPCNSPILNPMDFQSGLCWSRDSPAHDTSQ
uniref:Uncharacterized protein n=1 Tax=Meloidogyne enterolobii TaxID=390850 RepID=A0A6V7UNC9_MELEN|nr:unnamed protein product [Meloidogyne enterolobii]